MAFDFEAEVVAVSSQPFWLSWPTASGTRRHAPDFFARLSDGSALVVDVRADDRVDTDAAEVFAATAHACETVGWQYQRRGALDPVLAANLRWLSGYRHRRCFSPPLGDLLARRLAAVMPLADLVAGVGDRLAVLPTLYHLLWRGVIDADLLSAPLSGATVLSPGRSA